MYQQPTDSFFVIHIENPDLLIDACNKGELRTSLKYIYIPKIVFSLLLHAYTWRAENVFIIHTENHGLGNDASGAVKSLKNLSAMCVTKVRFFGKKNWESCVTKSRFFSGPQTKKLMFVTLTKHCPFQHLRSWYIDPPWMSRVGHSVDQGETMFFEKTTCRNLLFASHVLKTRRSRWWFRWFKLEFARGINLSAVFKVFSAER